jgi:hypothetical protein
LMGLSYFMPLLEAVNALIKFAQGGWCIHMWFCNIYKDLPNKFLYGVFIHKVSTNVNISKCFQMWWKTIMP